MARTEGREEGREERKAGSLGVALGELPSLCQSIPGLSSLTISWDSSVQLQSEELSHSGT